MLPARRNLIALLEIGNIGVPKRFLVIVPTVNKKHAL